MNIQTSGFWFLLLAAIVTMACIILAIIEDAKKTREMEKIKAENDTLHESIAQTVNAIQESKRQHDERIDAINREHQPKIEALRQESERLEKELADFEKQHNLPPLDLSKYR